MKTSSLLPLLVLLAGMMLALVSAAQTSADTNKDQAAAAQDSSATATDAAAPVNQLSQDESDRLEGEKRFHSNCSRCHAAPPKFPPRMMGTIVRHMRVRAMLSDQDMKLILRYMTK